MAKLGKTEVKLSEKNSRKFCKEKLTQFYFISSTEDGFLFQGMVPLGDFLAGLAIPSCT